MESDRRHTSTATAELPLASDAASLGDAAEHLDPERLLLQARLGVASSLFTAMKFRHPPTAAHSLRVTLSVSSWALAMGMNDEQRDLLEVAALLHDIGKIGVPDSILLKPVRLTAEEAAVMEHHLRQGPEVLQCCTDSAELLNIIWYALAWYDGSRPGFDLLGDDLPFGARMLSIVDAYDAMTSDKPYRRAIARDRALAELFRGAGTQFDPELVKAYAVMSEADASGLHEAVAQRWVDALRDSQSSLWGLQEFAAFEGDASAAIFQQTMLHNMRDAAIFLDGGMRITLWNTGAERMTGITAGSVEGNRFLPSLLELRRENGELIPDEHCPVLEAVASGEQRHCRYTLRGRGRKEISVDMQTVPVIGPDGTIHGATLLLHDVSPEISLEERCQSLQVMATRDPLTKAANRAEFNRVHKMILVAHLERNIPCALVLTDIDHFKKVNDTYGHQAGDEVLQAFAKVLKGACRPGDLVARYGGEEFAIVCADCDNNAATRRAEELRKRISLLTIPCLEGGRITASFGVTEVQHGDTPETMLARADRALYDAKGGGRNRVVQLGAGLAPAQSAPVMIDVEAKIRSDALVEQDLGMTVPISVAVEKLKGFVADQNAQIVSVERSSMRMRIGGQGFGWFRRAGDRHSGLLIDLQFQEAPEAADPRKRGQAVTRVHVAIRAQRSRDRRKGDVVERAKQLLTSLRTYLVAAEERIEMADLERSVSDE